jgi:LmbE family N-acetylglucosaminyl deacetylase
MVRAPRLAWYAVRRADALRRIWRALPRGTLDIVTGPRNALILAPHPDDESLGCGGLIAACCRAGRPPIVAILTDGGMSHPGSKAYPRERLVRLREAEARDAASVLGLPPDRLMFLREPDTNAPRAGDAFDRVVMRLIGLVDRFDCSAILAPWRFDPHCDHEAAAIIAAEVAMRLRIRHLAYPVWGWTLPPDHVVDAGTPSGWRLDIACHLARKLKAIAAHRSQYGELINDDPSGFRLPPGLLRAFAYRFETFLLP